ncbi:MAG: hypothetical protein ACXWID_13145 [Pyrinomonadaceae bacterium]
MTKTKWLTVVLMVVCVAVATSQTKAPQTKRRPEPARAARSFTIVTKPFLAFKDGSSVYKLGQPMSAFLASFGSAEKIERDEDKYGKIWTQEEYAKTYAAYSKTHYYGNDGLVITEDKGGAIFGITCYVVASKSDTVGAILPANCRTEEGITLESSLGEVIERYGAPFKRDMWEYSNTATYPERLELYLNIYYKYGDDVLFFGFKDGRLQTINLGVARTARISRVIEVAHHGNTEIVRRLDVLAWIWRSRRSRPRSALVDKRMRRWGRLPLQQGGYTV